MIDERLLPEKFMDFRASIANPEEFVYALPSPYGTPGWELWRLDFGSYGDLHIYVWSSSLQTALEVAAAYASERGWTIFEEPDLEEAREELKAEGNLSPSENQIAERATVDMTYTESGYLGYDWSSYSVWPESSEFAQVLLASQFAWFNYPLVNDIVIDPEEWEWDAWDIGRSNYDFLPIIGGWLHRYCDYLLPLQLYPHFITSSDRKQWTMVLACEQTQDEAIAALPALVQQLNLWDIRTVMRQEQVTDTNWIRVAYPEEHYLHEGDREPQEYAPRVRVVLEIQLSPLTSVEVQIIFVERLYGPSFIEFEEE